MPGVRFHLARLLRRRQAVRDLDEEIEAHLGLETRERIERGESPQQAAAGARREFGNATLIAELTREQWGWVALERLLRDVAHGARTLRRTPGFAVVAVLTLALGIGAGTAIFSVVHTVLLRPLPFPESERLVTLWTTAPEMNLPRAFVGIANYLDWRAQNRVFEDIAITRPIANLNLTGQGTPERLEGARINESLLPVLRVTPLLGRNITARERETDARVALLSYGLWVRRFAGDPAIVGRTIRLNGSPHEVIGVMPREFRYPTDRHEIWVPLYFPPDELQTRIGYNYVSVARLRRGVTLDKARADMDTIAARIARHYPEVSRGQGVRVEPMLESLTGAVREPLLAV
ncbi:MAG TPA: ABC transporter permease, partial [Bryobacteraceae bacterium]|nr:ABC transporter permease [Bryobacteraceae bacterium]